MNEATKSQLIEELNKAIKPEGEDDGADDGRVMYHQSTHALEINKELSVEDETKVVEKKPNEDEMFESLIERLNEQKHGLNKKREHV